MDARTIIDRLGGGTKVAHALTALTGESIDREAVYKWRERNVIPWKWRAHVSVLASRSPAPSESPQPLSAG